MPSKTPEKPKRSKPTATGEKHLQKAMMKEKQLEIAELKKELANQKTEQGKLCRAMKSLADHAEKAKALSLSHLKSCPLKKHASSPRQRKPKAPVATKKADE